MSTSHQLAANAVTLAYGDRLVFESLDLTVAPGRITAIVGANGCGKSTLLRALSRLATPRSGNVTLDGDELHRQRPKDVARVLGLLPQNPIAPEGLAVADLVGRGRHPHQRPLSPWTRRDHDVAHQIEGLDLLTDLNHALGTTIVMVLHDLNLAARYADELIAMSDGRIHASGPAEQVITSELVRDVFGLDCHVIVDPLSGAPMILPCGRHHSIRH